MNKEILSYVIRNRKPVTWESLRRAKVDVSRQADVYFSGRINQNTKVNLETINATYDYIVGQFYPSAFKILQLGDKFSSTNTAINLRFSQIFRDIEKAKAELAAMQILHRDASGYVKTINIDIGSASVTDVNNSTAKVEDGIVWGINDEPKSQSSQYVAVSKYKPANFTVYLSQVSKNQYGGVFADGLGVEESSQTDIVNTGAKFYAIASSQFDTAAEMQITLDRKEFSDFDNVEFKFSNAFIADVLVSRDGELFTKLTAKEFYAKEVNLRTVDRNARYVRLILNFAKPTYQDGGDFIYKADFEYLNVIRQTVENEYTFMTQNLQIDGSYTAIALGVCDNQISSKSSKVAIDYLLQINGSDFERIRPANSIHNGEYLLTTQLKLPRYSAAEVINIKSTFSNFGYYDFRLESAYGKIYGSAERIFQSNITRTSKDWKDLESYYEAFALLEKQKEINFGSEPIEVNGQWVSGKVHLQDGIYRIRTFKENYLNLFNTWKAKRVVFDRLGLYTIDDGRGNEVTVADPKFPNNHKVTVESQFDAVFADELKLDVNYQWYLNDDQSYSIHTRNEYHEGLYIVYRPHSKILNTVKLKAVMKSNDKITIPVIQKIMLRLS